MTSSPLLPITLADELGDPLLVAGSRTTPLERITPAHHHARGQLLGAASGLLSVEAGDAQWVVPATHAVWIPPDTEHGVRSHGPFSGWSVYVAPSACAPLPRTACMVAVSGLLREAIVRALSWDQSRTLDVRQTHVAAVILDEIQTLPHSTLGLPMPQDARLRKIAQALSDQPSDTRKLEQWAIDVSIAPRTLTRRFVAETGFSFTEWRQRVRMLRALEMLAGGTAVTTVALNLGYDNASAFIALFKRTFGRTPGNYMSTTRQDAADTP